MAKETVHIESEHFPGGVIIDKEEFDEKTMTLFVEKPAKAKSLEKGLADKETGGKDKQ
jgi:hypothetical protein